MPREGITLKEDTEPQTDSLPEDRFKAKLTSLFREFWETVPVSLESQVEDDEPKCLEK